MNSVELLNIYNALLYVGAVNNIIIALILVVQTLGKRYRPYRVYQRTCLMSALAIMLFGIGYLFHAVYQPRLTNPMLAGSLSVSYFHIGGVLFALSYTSLINHRHLTRRRVAVNMLVLCAGLISYWFPFMLSHSPQSVWKLAYCIFHAHTSYLAYRFFVTYRQTLRSDERGLSKYFMPLMHSLPRSSYIIVVFGIGCGILYAFFPDTVLLYSILMVVSYYAFFYIYRSLVGFGKQLIVVSREDGTELARRLRRKRKRIFSYGSTYHTTLLLTIVATVYFYSDIDRLDVYSNNTIEHLNLTKHALWDTPALGDSQVNELKALVYNSPDSVYMRKADILENDTVSYADAVRISREIDEMPDSYYKSYLQLICLNNTLFCLNEKEITPQRMHEFLEKGYEIAKGSNPVPQSIFLVFWGNCIINYSNALQADSVRKEAMRFMKICHQQKLPVGVIQAYTALGYCLMDAYDYQGASEQFDKALEMSDKYFPKILGKDWKKLNPDETDMLSGYVQTWALNARCHLEANDTVWLKEHNAELEQLLTMTKTLSLLANAYYALAIYNDKWGSKERYAQLMEEFRGAMEKEGYFGVNKDIFMADFTLQKYYTVQLRHELRAHHGDRAMEIINKLPEYFSDSVFTYLPDALLLQGKYKEAAHRYKSTVDYYYGLLNGHNRHLLKSMSSSVEDENHEMEIMQSKIENQQMHLRYNALLLFVFTIMIIGLVYFLYRQHRLNKELNEAVEAAEKANHAKDIFLKNMTHEIHTPLNAIYGFAQVLADREMPLDEDTTRMMADSIVEGSENLTNLLDNIIEATDKLSKLDSLEEVESILKAPGSANQPS